MSGKKECSPEYRDHVIPPGDNRNGGCAHGRLSIAYDRWNHTQNRLGKGYLSFASRAELFCWYTQQSPRCAYEILRESEPMCVGFDVECDNKDEKHVRVRDALRLGTDPDTFLANVTRRLAVMFPQLADGEPLVSTSHKPGVKLSFHLKYPHVCLLSMEQRQLLSKVIRTSELFPVVDPSAYTLNRMMRLLWSSKLPVPGAAPAPARPLIPVPACFELDARILELHSWTAVPEGAVPLDLHRYESSDSMEITGMSTSTGRRSRSTANLDRAVREASSLDDSWVGAIRQLLRDNNLSDSADRQVNVQSRSVHGPGGKSYFHTAGVARRCPHGGTHESNNFVVNVTDYGLAFLHCFGTACQEKRDFRLGFLSTPSLMPKNALVDSVYATTLALTLKVPVESVGPPQWTDTRCTFELGSYACALCSAPGLSRAYVCASSGGKVLYGHPTRGDPCEKELAVHTRRQMLEAFAEARDADSRALSREEILAVAQATALNGSP